MNDGMPHVKLIVGGVVTGAYAAIALQQLNERYGAELRGRVKVAKHALLGRPLLANAHVGPTVLGKNDRMFVSNSHFDMSLDEAPAHARRSFERLADEFGDRLESEMRKHSAGLHLTGDGG